MRRVEFPFVSGQQEGVDPKILPAGTLAAARNVMVRKDGYLVRRRALEPVSMTLPVGSLEGLARELCVPDKVLCEMEDSVGTGVVQLTRMGQAGALVDAARLVGTTGSSEFVGDPEAYPGITSPERPYAPVSPFGGVRKTEIAPRIGACGVPQVVTTWGGAVATLTMQQDTYTTQRTDATRYVIELRDPETMVVFHTYVADLAGTGAIYVSSARLVASKTRPLIAAVFAYRDEESQGHVLVKAYDAEAPYREYKPVRPATPVSGNRSDYVYADVLPSDLIAIALNELDPLTADSSVVKVRVLDWAYTLAEDDGHAVGFTIDNGEGGSAFPRGVFGGNGGEFLVIWEDADGHHIETCQAPDLLEDSTVISHTTFGFSVGAYEIVREGAVWDGANSRWNIAVGGVTEFPYGAQERTSEECITRSHFWDGTTLSVERTFYGALPVSSPVAENSARWLAVEVATGTGIDNWAPNYASGVQLLELSTGLVLGQLSPDAGGMDIWNGTSFARELDGTYYVVSGALGAATGSRANSLFSFERRVGQSIATRTGETLIAGAVIAMCDGSDAGMAGFSAAPEVKVTTAEEGGGLPQGRYLVAAVLEVTDANGRTWRSAPSSPQQVETTGEENNRIEIVATCGKGAPASGDVFVAFYRTEVNPSVDPAVTQDGEGGAVTVTGFFGLTGDYELTITSPSVAPSGEPNGDAEFELRRDGKILASGEVVPTTPFEFAIPDTASAKLIFENGNYFHGTTYRFTNRVPLEGTVLYRIGGTRIPQGGESAEFVVTTDIPGFPYQALQDQPRLYTEGGTVLGNNAPPSADFLCTALGRIWAGGLPDRSRIQASKILVPELGVEWSNFDSFFLTFPEEVVGLASVDETLMVFTTRGVYLASGGGPDNRGFGEFHSSQRLPGTCGCVNARSIVVSDLGVFYQTARGIELVGRGFSAATWIGQGVRDQVDRFPFCWGACALPDGTVRFLMGGGEETGASVLLVWDQRSMGWYVHTYAASEIQGGRAGLGETLGRMTLADWSTGQVRREGAGEFLSDEPAYIETGWLRPAGINSDHRGRRLCLLGQFLGPTGRVDLDIALAFDDLPYNPRHVGSYVIEAGDGLSQYLPGGPVELQLTLPVMHFSSVRAKVAWRPAAGAAESVALSGLTVFIEPNPEGQRVGRKSKR